MTRRKIFLFGIVASAIVIAIGPFLFIHHTKTKIFDNIQKDNNNEIYDKILANRKRLDSTFKEIAFTDTVKQYLKDDFNFGDIVVKIKETVLHLSIVDFNWESDVTARDRAREVATAILAFKARHQNLSVIMMDTWGGAFEFDVYGLQPVADKVLKKMTPLVAVLDNRTDEIKAAIKRISDAASIQIKTKYGVTWKPNYSNLFVARSFDIKCPLNKHGNFDRILIDNLKKCVDSIEDRERIIINADGLYFNNLDGYDHYPRWFQDSKAPEL